MTTAPPGTFLAEDEPDLEPVVAPERHAVTRERTAPLTRRELRARSRRRALRRRAPPSRPQSADESRVATRRVRRRRQRLQDITIFVVALVLVLVIGHAAEHNGSSAPGANPAPGTAAARAATLVMAHRGATGDADFISVLGAHGQNTAVLLVPTSTLVEVPSYDVQSLGAALRLGGPLLLQTALSNALAIDVGPVLALDDAQLAALLGPAGTLSIRSGSVQDVAAGDATHRLVDRNGTPELDHLVDAQAVMTAWFRALGRSGVVDATAGQVPRVPDTRAAADPTAVTTILRAVAGRGAQFDTVAVQRMDSGSEAYRMTRAPLPKSIASAFTGRALGSHRLRVEILNGTGEVGLAQRVAAKLVPAGYEVVLTNNAPKFGHATTLVVVQDRKNEGRARSILQVLGVGKLGTASRPISVADVTIVVGADF